MKTEKLNSIVNRLLPDMLKQTSKESSDVENKETSVVVNQVPEIRHNDIESAWFQLIEDNFKAHSYVYNVYKDTLVVKIDSSCYLSMFNMKKRELLKKVQEAGFFYIKKIEFKI
ncbi:DUF721 domain-containing protein [bacterium]|nr:DUF721 domain-containing protein [bacterium]